MAIDVVDTARKVHEHLVEELGLVAVPGRSERFALSPEASRDGDYLEVGTTYGEVRIRFYVAHQHEAKFDIIADDHLALFESWVLDMKVQHWEVRQP